MGVRELEKVFRLIDEKDWVLWEFQVSILLKSHNAFQIAKDEEKPPAEGANKHAEELATHEKLDVKAQKVISSTIGKEALMYIVSCKNAAEIWTMLKSIYEKKSESSIHFLLQDITLPKIRRMKNIAKFTTRLQELAQQLNELGEYISDKNVMTIVLLALPPKLEHLVSAWESTPDVRSALDGLERTINDRRIAFNGKCTKW